MTTIPTIHAELAWTDTATALGIVARGPSPVLVLCRKLVDAGQDLATRLEAWRGGVLCLRVRSIGEAAQIEVGSKGIGFVPAVRAASPIRQIDSAHTQVATP
jgi:hypothetical protein